MSRELPDHLHLGCGLTTPPGWLNVDGSIRVVIARHRWLRKVFTVTRLMSREQAEIPWSASILRLNLTRPLPFPDGHFAAVYSSHLMEHLYHHHALTLLKECHRVLRPGGVCRAVVPDLEVLVANYADAKKAADPCAGTRLMEGLLVHDKSPGSGLLGYYHRITGLHQHKWMYDAASLGQLFAEAGFGSVRRAEYLESRIKRIAEVEDPGRVCGGEGVVVEGIKE